MGWYDFSTSTKGVFRNTLVEWAGQLKIFGIILYCPPPFASCKTFWTPSTCHKLFWHPPLLGVKYQFLSWTTIMYWIWCTIVVIWTTLKELILQSLPSTLNSMSLCARGVWGGCAPSEARKFCILETESCNLANIFRCKFNKMINTNSSFTGSSDPNCGLWENFTGGTDQIIIIINNNLQFL